MTCSELSSEESEFSCARAQPSAETLPRRKPEKREKIMSFLDSAISSIGQNLAKTATDQISQSTGINVGGALGYLFGNGQASGGANMDALGPAIAQAFAQQQQTLTLLQAELYQQSQALAAMGQQLVGIASALTQITGMIQNLEQMLQKIGQEQLFQAWQAVDNQMTNYIAAIDAAFATYGNYLSSYKTTPSSEVSLLIQNILNVNVGPVVGLRAIHDFMIGGGQARGTLQLWSLMVVPLVQQGVLDYRLAVRQYFQYYQKLTYAQLKAVNLVMEAYTFNNDPNNARNAWTQYRRQLLSQEDGFITWLVPLVYAGVQGGVFPLGPSQSSVVNFTAYDASMQLNPGVQAVRGDTDIGDSFYAPSQVFEDAEQLLANLYVTGPSARRIVVHMLYPNGAGISTLLDGLNLTLSSVGSAETVQPVSNSRLGGPFQFPRMPQDYSPMFPDQNIYTGNGFYLKRYVYSGDGGTGLANGQYNVTNLNGHDGLVAMQTYLTTERGLNKAPFQQHDIVTYPMEIDNADKFDFMNFVAYSVPSIYPG
ncbi:MAG TPA: hypothetical protein VGM17_17025 [Rhizomicrobium sp.]